MNRRGYIDFDEMCALFKTHGFFYAQPLMRGTYEECMAWEVEGFVTTLPALFKLPPLPDNFAEGVCVRTAKTAWVSDGSR